jgi:hypothetical protein
MAKTYILGYDKTAVDKEAVKLTFNNIYKGTLVPTFMICDDLKMHQQLNGFGCYYKGTTNYCLTLCGNCIEVLSMVLK